MGETTPLRSLGLLKCLSWAGFLRRSKDEFHDSKYKMFDLWTRIRIYKYLSKQVFFVSKSIEFVVVDHTDNSGYTAHIPTQKELDFFKEHGVLSAVNTFYVRQVLPMPEDVEKFISETIRDGGYMTPGDYMRRMYERMHGEIEFYKFHNANFNACWKDRDVKVNELNTQLDEHKHEVERFKVLIKIADELITNDNAREDWKNAKSTIIM